jgi:hypothetical protein
MNGAQHWHEERAGLYKKDGAGVHTQLWPGGGGAGAAEPSLVTKSACAVVQAGSREGSKSTALVAWYKGAAPAWPADWPSPSTPSSIGAAETQRATWLLLRRRLRCRSGGGVSCGDRSSHKAVAGGCHHRWSVGEPGEGGKGRGRRQHRSIHAWRRHSPRRSCALGPDLPS